MRPYYDEGGVTIYHCDFREAPIDPESVAAVITDPPYPREYLPLWAPLGVWSERVLEDGGSLLSIVPHYALPEVLEAIGPSLKYRWVCAMWQHEGAHPRMAAIGIQVCWKPVVWWLKGTRPWGGCIPDGFENRYRAPTRDQPKQHRWAQALCWARYCLKFVPPGGLVVDPFLGSGTLLDAARQLGYRAIGMDSDERACAIAAGRLSQMLLPLEA